MTYSSTETKAGLPIPSRVEWQGLPGLLWGLGFDPKGELLMIRLDDTRSIEAHAEDVQPERPTELC